LAKKAERLDMLSKHIDKEKLKVKERFEDIRKSMLDIIALKEKECLKLLEDEISGLSDVYTQYEKLLVTGWLKSSDMEALYPTSDVLEQRISKIINLEQFEALMKEVAEDIDIEKQYGDDKDGLEKRKDKIASLISHAQKVESSLPVLQGKLLDSSSEGLQSLTKELLKGFDQQEIRVGNSVAFRMEKSYCESQIIDGKQYEVLKNLFPNSRNLSLKLLYRGSQDGMSAQMFHKKCDDKGATVTFIKSRFKGVASSRVIGGFVDQSWHSKSAYTGGNKAFLFSMAEGAFPVKCDLMRPERAFYGSPIFGPCFGGGQVCDLQIQEDFKIGKMHPNSYSNSIALHYNNQDSFVVEDVEVFQVQDYISK